jgi:hypothetical protein
MTTKTRLENVLKKARKTLVRHKDIDSPVFHIRSKNAAIPPVIFHPSWHDEESKTKSFVELHKICRETEAREVLIVCNTFLYKGEDTIPSSEGILVSLEDCAGMQSVILPYKMSGHGKITFEKERWISAEKKDIAGRMVGFVQ